MSEADIKGHFLVISGALSGSMSGDGKDTELVVGAALALLQQALIDLNRIAGALEYPILKEQDELREKERKEMHRRAELQARGYW